MNRFAVITDIHGNLAALEAVLADMDQYSPDAVICAGDLAANGPKPRETVELIAGSSMLTIRGNMDDSVLTSDWPASAWAREQIGRAGLAFLNSLSFSCRITPPGGRSPMDDLLVAHSTPRSNDELLILELHPQTTSFQKLTPPEEAAQMLAGSRAGLIVYGHIHYFSAGEIGEQRLASIGSVGFPFDGDPRAAYGLLDWDGHGWAVTPVRVVYDYEGAAADIERSGQPAAARYAAMLRQASWLPMGLFQSPV
jgi:predicted phosphodiesterase